MREITVPSSAVALRSEQQLTPAMVAAVWEIANALDHQRIPANVPNAVWLDVQTAHLRGEGGRSDNVWLRECLDRLLGVKISGEHKGDPWGAVVLAEWRIIQGGTVARLLIPPAGVHALRSPQTFTKIETQAAHRLSGHARRLYALLADKKRLGRPHWTFPLSELRSLLGVDDKTSYQRWNNLRQWVIDPALEAINDFGTVSVRMTPEKIGRSVNAIRFDWQWKDPHEASETASENERHSAARRQAQASKDAPPMIEEPGHPTDALKWWHGLTDAERDSWADRVGRTVDLGLGVQPRPERAIAENAMKLHLAAEPVGRPK